jgi:hypothetical protein
MELVQSAQKSMRSYNQPHGSVWAGVTESTDKYLLDLLGSVFQVLLVHLLEKDLTKIN